jgi:NifU-like protein involved in Fe-S cluster formation
MTTLSDIYNTRIMELAANTPATPRLVSPQATATAHSKLCGSTVTLDIDMEGDRIVRFGQTVKACLLGQAAAAIVAAQVVGSTAAEVRAVARAMRAMLKDNGPPPDGRWSDLAVLEPVKDYRARHASTLLVFDALERAIDEIEAARRAHPAVPAAAAARA